MFFLSDNQLSFPDVSLADEDGLLAIGGSLNTERLLLAYRSGIFPWFNEDELPMWWSPDPRFVLFPEELKISSSMKQILKKNQFDFKINHAFAQVINCCKNTPRKEQDGTWITDNVVAAYKEMHQLGFAISAESYCDDKLVGGLYGIRMGAVFFGESMFSHQSNASKFAFIRLVQQLKAEGVKMIDCQVYTEHLESLGARMIPRISFIKLLRELIQ